MLKTPPAPAAHADQRTDKLRSAWQIAQEGAEHADHLFQEGSGLLQPVQEAKLHRPCKEDVDFQSPDRSPLTTVLLYRPLAAGKRLAPESAPRHHQSHPARSHQA